MAKTTVFYNGVRDIEFEVSDASGVVHAVTVKGSGAKLRGLNAQPLPSAGAYGVTVVDDDWWAAVKKAYAEHPDFKGGFIMDGDSEKAKAEAQEAVASLDNGQAPAAQEEAGKRKATKKK